MDKINSNPVTDEGQVPSERQSLIASYINANLALIPIPAGQKGPTSEGWNQRANCITTQDQAVTKLRSNIGLAHAYCDPPTCAIDIDDLEKARAYLAKHGIDLDALLSAPDAVRIDSGREGRAKLLYRLGVPLAQKKVKDCEGDILDFRCATQDGLTVQDVLPPSIHPDTGQPYQLLGDILAIPPIPAALLHVWLGLLEGIRNAAPVGDLPPRFTELLAGDEALARRWAGDTEGLNDPSRNGLDMSVTALLVKRGFTDAEISKILKAYVHGKVYQDGRGERDSYITDMIAKARRDRILSRAEPMPTAYRMLAECFSATDGTSLLRRRHGDFYQWRSGAYQALDEDDVSAKVWGYLGGARHYVNQGKTEAYGANQTRVNNVLGALKAITHFDSSTHNPGWLDGASGHDPRDLLVLANGLLHMPSRTLQPHDPRLFTTTALPYAYEPGAGTPTAWLAFLQSIWGDDIESIQTLQEIFGYCLTADSSQQKMFLIIGPKRSGKGTIARVLRALIGEANCAGPTLASLATNFGLQPLIGKRLGIISDARLGNRTDKSVLTERLCSISGEDALTIDRKYREPWTGTLGTRVVIFTNELPKITDDSNALSSRFVLLRLMQSFYGREDLGLADRLLKELPAILNWALDGLERLMARGYFRQPDSAQDIVEEFEDLASPISAFIHDCCVVEPTAQADIDHLYLLWQMWHRHNGWDFAGTRLSFCNSLRAALPELKRVRETQGKRGRKYQGIGVAPSRDAVNEFFGMTPRFGHGSVPVPSRLCPGSVPVVPVAVPVEAPVDEVAAARKRKEDLL